MPFAPLGALDLYHEEHGSGGVPLLLVPGGHHTIDLTFSSVLAPLSSRRRVVAVEQQGHGRTADVDRTPTLDALAGDLLGLLDHLGLEQVDVCGFSLGALTGLLLAIRHPERVRRLVFASGFVRAGGYHPDITDPDRWATSTRMPTEEDFAAMRREHERLAPDGAADLDDVMAKLGPVVMTSAGWTDEELRRVTAPTLVMIGDHDFVTVSHAELTRDLLPDATLAVVPRSTHTRLMHRTEIVLPLIEDHLAG
ncbi:alpha/beta hydrolase [Actinomycetospora corticicola]|uniref:Pimeloyl-ACP methyl ester carboxylesterase n=1 Tax=Actinomycetospora corticicola TaxID=663602 RepID=A0A7Y9J896_9PSEU|nr:alpha/beta hydrolase [Actinomycetospora corticicola]NYD39205.1 pimeloyl-ACP methyl ester carboxylesterase [Actinomycetospora corticicola]